MWLKFVHILVLYTSAFYGYLNIYLLIHFPVERLFALAIINNADLTVLGHACIIGTQVDFLGHSPTAGEVNHKAHKSSVLLDNVNILSTVIDSIWYKTTNKIRFVLLGPHPGE